MDKVNFDLQTELSAAHKSLWWERDVDLIVRRNFLGEINPAPIASLSSMEWPGDYSAFFDSLTLRGLSNIRSHLKIDEQEDRLLGRNRFATEEQRVMIWIQERGNCAYCETPVPPMRMHADHVEAFYFDGKTVVENLVCSCRDCNEAKGVMDGLQFLYILGDEPLAARKELLDWNRKNR